MKQINFREINSKKYTQKAEPKGYQNNQKPKHKNNNQSKPKNKSKKQESYSDYYNKQFKNTNSDSSYVQPSHSYEYEMLKKALDDYQAEESRNNYHGSGNSNPKPNKKKKRKSYKEYKRELDSYIENIKQFTKQFIKEKKKELGFFKRIVHRINGEYEYDMDDWFDELCNSYEIEDWMEQINDLVDYIFYNFDKDLTDYVTKELGKAIPEEYMI